MPISGSLYTFNQKNVDLSPDEHGVYALYDQGVLIYIGRAIGKGVTIRSRLRSHLKGNEGRCTQGATDYRREPTEDGENREIELLEEFQAKFGDLPRCNEKVA